MITIVNYGMGNLGSIVNMSKKAEVEAVVASAPAEIARAEKLILPGVGAFDHGMRGLTERGLLEPLCELALQQRVPILGICLGMQLMTKSSEEGSLPGLGWIDARTRRFHFPGESGRKIPHMGWNTVEPARAHPLLAGLETDNRFYFVHSYRVECADETDVLGRTDYGGPFTSCFARGNLLGVQFHPEKSHRFGLRLLQHFAGWEGGS